MAQLIDLAKINFGDNIHKVIYIPVTYSELVTLRDNSKLKAGSYYRITDYETTTVESDTQSAGHPFDVIVEALTPNTLSPNAKAAAREGNSYFDGHDLSTWELSYSLDNDTSLFAWADAVNGKGVIYRLKDDYNNDLPYDFKNIQFKRYYVASVDANYTDALNDLIGLPIALAGTGSWKLTPDTTYKWYYTFSLLGDSWSDEVTDGSLTSSKVFGTVIESTPQYAAPITLGKNVFANGPVIHNFLLSFNSNMPSDSYISFNNKFLGESNKNNTLFGGSANNYSFTHFRNNTIIGLHRHSNYSSNTQNNTIFVFGNIAFNNLNQGFYENVVRAESFCINTIGNQFADNYLCAVTAINNNNFGESFSNNKIITAKRIYACTFGHHYQNNTFNVADMIACDFDNYCIQNTITITTTCSNNHFLENLCQNTITSSTFSNNLIGPNFKNNEINGGFSSNNVTGQITYCKFLSNVYTCNITAILQYVTIPANTSDTPIFGCADIRGSIRGTSSSYIILEHPSLRISGVSGIKRRVSIEGDTNGRIVASWYEGGQRQEITKLPADANWTNIGSILVNEPTATAGTNVSVSTAATNFGVTDADIYAICWKDGIGPKEVMIDFGSDNISHLPLVYRNHNSTTITVLYGNATSNLGSTLELTYNIQNSTVSYLFNTI